MLKTLNKRQKWLDMMEKSPEWKDAIDNSISSTVNIIGENLLKDVAVFKATSIAKRSKGDCSIIFNGNTTQQNLYEQALTHDKVCLLNFASFYKPGGGFLSGANAQEESLCACSGLFPILKINPVYKERAANRAKSPLYRSEIIYSKEVPFTDKVMSLDTIILADVITCAAPNVAAANPKSKEVFDIAYDKEMIKRTEAILVYPLLAGAKVLILGAWGCGVFRNDPEVVGKYFAQACNKYGAGYDAIVFGIPDRDMRDSFMKGFFSVQKE